MKLITKKILDDFRKQGSVRTKSPEEIRIIAKYFNPAGAGTWYGVEYDPDSRIMYGFAEISHGELGSWSMNELEEFVGPFGWKIERDLYFGEHYLSEVIAGKRP
jgi:hypothetical protein